MLIQYQDVLSTARLKTYRDAAISDEAALSLYLWNIALSVALFPVLALLEVTLRNQLDKAISIIEPSWLNPNWKGWALYRIKQSNGRVVSCNIELENLTKAVQKFNNAPRGKLIAELNFGFWVGMLKPSYKPTIWTRKGPLQAAFPNLIFSKADPIATVHGRLKKINQLRNRIFHHEPIFNRPGLEVNYNELLEVLDWMTPSIYRLAQKLSRFPEVLEQGPEYYL